MADHPKHFFVNGIVAHRNKQPYIQLSNENGLLGQFSLAEARQIADDIMQMAARTEADAMILKFFDAQEFPEGAGAALMLGFRDYRAEQDEARHRVQPDPDTN